MRRKWIGQPDREPAGADGGALAPRDFAGLFVAPRWLKDFGATAWLVVGVTLFLVAVVWLLTLTQTIVIPFITACVVAAVASPLVAALQRRGVRRGLGTTLVLLGLVVLAGLVAFIVLAGVTSQLDQLRVELRSARETIAGWLKDLGVDAGTADRAQKDVSSSLSTAVPALLEGVGKGLKQLSSLAVFLSLAFLSTFFLLKDGPQIRHWAEGHLRMPRHVAHGIGQRVLQALRGYFVGVTFVAIFNAAVVGLGALLLGVPLAGTIAVITFLGAYVPYLGAWGAGAFSVLIALGGAGTDAAIGMAIVQLLANGMLQQVIQPIAYGSALGIHPLAVLLVTIAGGSLFGAVGLILSAPLTAAATRIAADLAAGRAEPASAASAPWSPAGRREPAGPGC